MRTPTKRESLPQVGCIWGWSVIALRSGPSRFSYTRQRVHTVRLYCIQIIEDSSSFCFTYKLEKSLLEDGLAGACTPLGLHNGDQRQASFRPPSGLRPLWDLALDWQPLTASVIILNHLMHRAPRGIVELLIWPFGLHWRSEQRWMRKHGRAWVLRMGWKV